LKFIHTADWHLGRQLREQSLIEDQAWALDRLLELVAAEKPDAVVISGDVYDRAVPPAEAVALLDRTLTRLVIDLGVPVVMIAGNHDSPERVGFGSAVLGGAGLHVAGTLGADVASVVLGEGEGLTRLWLLPYADPIETRAALADTSIHDHEAAVAACVERIRAVGATEPNQVLVTHHFVAGGLTSDSERPLSVGGTGAVSSGLFEGFAYVALGHLHRPQVYRDGRCAYAGSLLKYSFDEHNQRKSVSVVEVSGGAATVREVQLGALRDVRRIEGTLDEVLLGAASDDRRDDYLEVSIAEDIMPPDALGRVRELYPNVMHIHRSADFLEPDAGAEPASRQVESLTDEEIFERFFEYSTGEKLADDMRKALHSLLAERTRGEAR